MTSGSNVIGNGSNDVLSSDEESAVIMVRQIIDGIRERGIPVRIDAIEIAMIEEGASMVKDGKTRDFKVLRLRSANFALTLHLHSIARIEINFNPDRQ